MFRIDSSSAVTSLPEPAADGAPGFFTGGDPSSGVPPTTITPDFLNMVQEEIMNVVVAGGEAPSKSVFNQLLTALKSLFAPLGAAFGVDQTLVDLTTATGALARAANTPFTNTTPRPIEVKVAMTASAAGWYTYTMDGVTVLAAGTYGTTLGGTINFTVPPGKTAKVGCTNGTPTIVQWVELR